MKDQSNKDKNRTNTEIYIVKLQSIRKIETKKGTRTLLEASVVDTVYGRKRKSIRLGRSGPPPAFFKKCRSGVIRLSDAGDEPEEGWDTYNSGSFWSDVLDIGPGGVPIRWPPAGGGPGGNTPDPQPGDPGTGPGGDAPPAGGGGGGIGGGGTGGGGMPPIGGGEPTNPGPFEELCANSKDPEACVDFMTRPLPIPKPEPDDGGGGHTGGDTSEPDTGDTGSEAAGLYIF